MPVANSLMSIGYYQNTIYLIGGSSFEQALIKYHLLNDTFSYDLSFFTKTLYSLSPWWFQMNDVLYMTGDFDGDMINTYNLATNTFNSDVYRVPDPIPFAHCLTGDPNQSLIFYFGGNSYPYDTVQILNISNMAWSYAPNMNTRRAYISCIVSPNNNLYAIGGQNTNGELDSIEFISTININFGTWSYTQQNLSQPLAVTGCVAKSENVFIIGGSYVGLTYTDKVHIINTKTNEVSLSNANLVYNLSDSAPIVFDNKIYAFGGRNFSLQEIDRWQYIEISHISPEEQIASPSQSSLQTATTNYPTIAITKYPTTANPTIIPSQLTTTPSKITTTNDLTTSFSTITKYSTTANPTTIPSQMATTNDPNTSFRAITRYPTTANPTIIPKEGQITYRFTSTASQTNKEHIDSLTIILIVLVSVIFLCGIVLVFVVSRLKHETNSTDGVNVDVDIVNMKEEKNVGKDKNIKSQQVTKRYIVEDSLSDDGEKYDNQQITKKAVNDTKDKHDQIEINNNNIRPEGMLMNGGYHENKHVDAIAAKGTTNGNETDVGDV